MTIITKLAIFWVKQRRQGFRGLRMSWKAFWGGWEWSRLWRNLRGAWEGFGGLRAGGGLSERREGGWVKEWDKKISLRIRCSGSAVQPLQWFWVLENYKVLLLICFCSVFNCLSCSCIVSVGFDYITIEWSQSADAFPFTTWPYPLATLRMPIRFPINICDLKLFTI